MRGEYAERAFERTSGHKEHTTCGQDGARPVDSETHRTLDDIEDLRSLVRMWMAC